MKSMYRNLMTGLLVAGILVGLSGCSYKAVTRQVAANPEAVDEAGPVMLEPVVVTAERMPDRAAPVGSAARSETARHGSVAESVQFLD